jgi:hypothetical protein
MQIRSVAALWFGLLIVLPPMARAQGRATGVALARLGAAPDSSAPTRRTWSETGAIVGGVGGSAALAVAFYHFTHRNGAINGKTGTVGGTLVGAALGAAGGALLGAFVGSLFPKRQHP